MNDKFLLLCIIASIILVTFSFSYSESDNFENEDYLIGVSNNVMKKSTGYVFDIVSIDNDVVHCFSKNKIEKNCIYKVKGNYSSDNSMFFISELCMCQTN